MKIPSRKNHAFTLLEIMLVVTIIALLLTGAIVALQGNLEFGADTRLKSDLQTFDTNLNLYRARNGFYPSTDQGLEALVTRPTTEPIPSQWYQAIRKVPKDPWQSDYIYLNPGTHNPNGFDIFSSGSDKKVGTADDVGNWEAEKK